MLEYSLAVRAVEMFGKPNASACIAQEPSQSCTAGFPGMREHVLAVESDQVEGIEENCPGTGASGQCRAQPLKVGQSPVVDHHTFAIERGRLDRQRRQRVDNLRDFVGPVLAPPAIDPY